MRESQYIDRYLDGPRYTVQTFLAYQLSGRARRYTMQYLRALMRAINRRVADGSVVACRSVHGSVSYRRVNPV